MRSDDRDTVIFPMIDRTWVDEADPLLEMVSANLDAESSVRGSSDAGTWLVSHLCIEASSLSRYTMALTTMRSISPAGTLMPPGSSLAARRRLADV